MKNNTLTLAQAVERCPSIDAHRPSIHVSTQYKQINTFDVLSTLVDKGWQIKSVSEAYAKKTENKGFTKHMIKLTHPEFRFEGLDSMIPQIVLVNSHDATAALRFFVGLLRLACLNGLIVGDKTYSQSRIIHRGQSVDVQLKNALIDLTKNANKVVKDVKALRETELNPQQTFNLMLHAAKTRWGSFDKIPKRIQNAPNGILNLLRVRRDGDKGLNAWRVMNRLQENMLRGLQGSGIRRVNSIDERVRINKTLWDKTIQICQGIEGTNLINEYLDVTEYPNK